MSFNALSRENFSPYDSIEYIWRRLGLPETSLVALRLSGDGLGLPSSFKVGHLAQAAIALSALTAALIHAHRNSIPVARVSVPLQHAAIEFKSERLYSVAGKPAPSAWGPVGGLHKAADGYVRMHDGFPNHRNGALKLLGLDVNAEREQVAEAISKWAAIDLENVAIDSKVVIAALRSYEQWDCLPQSRAVSDFPISIRKIGDSEPGLPHRLGPDADQCLRGLRVLEMSRVIAAPVSGRTLAAHGADVLWVTTPNLPDLPIVDRDTARGKRTIHIDIDSSSDRDNLHTLLSTADVFTQGFRPGSLASKDLSPSALAEKYPGIICANLSAYGPDGPWSERRGFDSIVQTCSGMNISEAEHFGAGEPARPMPCQALDHAGGYFLATGILAALYKKATIGGSYEVNVSLAGVMKFLRSLGQYEGRSGFNWKNFEKFEDVPVEYLETRSTAFGEMTAIKHSATIEGLHVGWHEMPKPLGSDIAKWL